MGFSQVVIVNNPLARQGRSQDSFAGWKILQQRFACQTAAVYEAPRLLRRLAAGNKRTVVVVFGGDGTVNRLLPDLLATRMPLAVFPAGTVNDFATQMGLTSDWEDLARLIAEDRRQAIDLVAVNGHPIVAYASIGLGASTSALASRTRAIMAPLRQIAPTLVAPINTTAAILFKRRYLRALRLEDIEGAREVVTPGLYISNLPRLNRTIRLCGAAGNKGGRFGTYVLNCSSRLDLLKTVFTIQKHKDIAAIDSRITVLSGPWLAVSDTTELPFDVYGDGEFLLRTHEAHFSVLPATLGIFTPAAHAPAIAG